jgi:predicted transposase/invertase (TIGR01784 family)
VLCSQRREAEQKAQDRGEARGEARKQQEIALRMLQKNMPLETIAELTELSIDQLQILQSQLENN